MSQPSAPPTIRIEQIPDESNHEYLLRLAAEFITHFAPGKEIYNDDYEEAIDGTTLAKDLLDLAQELAQERARQSMKFRGVIIQAGGDEDPTVTISTTKRELADCEAIPFYKSAEITITPT